MGSHPPPEPGRLLAALARVLAGQRLPFMLIGGQAVLLHGRPRLTEDIDITLGVGPDRLPDVQRVCADLGLTALPDDVAGFVRRTFVLPARDPASGLRVDFIFSTTPYERQAIERAVRVELEGEAIPFATAEDLLIHKLFAGRPRDWEDAESVVRRKGPELDWRYVERWISEFAGVPGREQLRAQLASLRRLMRGA